MNRTLALAFMSCNRIDGVERSLESVLAQTLEDIDVVVSDDASDDGTFERLGEVLARYDGPKRIRLRRNARRLGVVGHFNAIMAETQADYVMFAHDDDFSEPGRAAAVLAAIAGAPRPPGAVFHHARQLDPAAAGGAVGPGRRIEVWPQSVPVTAEEVARRGGNIVGAVATYSRRVFSEFGPLPPEAHFEDSGALFRAALLGDAILLDAALVGKRTHEGALTGGTSVGASRSGHAARAANLRNMRNLRAVPDVWRRDLETYGDRLPGGEARRIRLEALLLALRERVDAEIGLLERRPDALWYWTRRLAGRRTTLREYLKMVLFAWFPELWRRYVALRDPGQGGR
ncbi:MAG TPA: glycosyltransferase family A protein [Lacipirellulaceae bacterium]|nr:glycosyltransferase family A protein [Lacipirellulaceae bacterium]